MPITFAQLQNNPGMFYDLSVFPTLDKLRQIIRTTFTVEQHHSTKTEMQNAISTMTDIRLQNYLIGVILYATKDTEEKPLIDDPNWKNSTVLILGDTTVIKHVSTMTRFGKLPSIKHGIFIDRSDRRLRNSRVISAVVGAVDQATPNDDADLLYLLACSHKQVPLAVYAVPDPNNQPLRDIVEMTRVLLGTLPSSMVEVLRSSASKETDSLLDELGAFPPNTEPTFHVELKDTK